MSGPERERPSRNRMAVIGAILILAASVIAFLSLFPLGSPGSHPTGTPVAAATNATANASSYQKTTDPNTSPSNVVGQIHVEYPVRIFTFGSDSVFVEISIPSLLATIKPQSMTRVPLSLEDTSPINALGEFNTNILLSDIMRVTFSSPSFQSIALYPERQRVSLTKAAVPTKWAWTIRAPGVNRSQVFVLRVFLKNDNVPIWLGSFRISVVEPAATRTPIPTSTPTPVPLPGRIINKLIEGISLQVCLGIPATIAAIIALVNPVRKAILKRRKANAARRKETRNSDREEK